MIGITGGIATGKSTVSARLRQLGAKVLDADCIAKAVVEPHTPGWKKVKKAFPDVIRPDSTIDRQELGTLIFSDAQSRRILEEIIHPEVIAELKRLGRYYEERGYTVFCDIPLLYETGCDAWLDEVWVVYTDPATQLARLMRRDGIDADEAKKRIQAQMPLTEKIRRADRLINNSDSLNLTRQQVDMLWEEWKRENRPNRT